MSSASVSLGAVPAPDDLLHLHSAVAPERLLELLPAAVYVCDRNGLILRYNRRAAELWGREPKLGDPAELFCGSYRMYHLDGEPMPPAACPMAQALRTGMPVRDREVVIERPDGRRAVALVNIDLLKDCAGAIVGAINCFQDITERRQAQAAVGERERRLREMLQALPVAVYTTDAAGRITFYNEAAAELWGVRPEIGKGEFCGSWKLYWPDGTPLPHDQCPMALALREKQPNRGMEAVAERPDGTRVQFLPFPVPLWDENGGCIGALNTLVDISERKRGEASLRESETKFRSIFAHANDAIFVVDPAANAILDANPRASRLLGYGRDELLATPISAILPGETAELAAFAQRVRAEGSGWTDRLHCRTKDGRIVPAEISAARMQWQGRVCIIAMVRDITERVRADEQRDLLLREMRHRTKNLFAVASGIVSLGARSSESRDDMVRALQGRLQALARAHELTLPDLEAAGARSDGATTLPELLQTIVSPFVDSEDEGSPRIVLAGPAVPIGGAAVTSVALLFHEFATNAVKYGALSSPAGSVGIEWAATADDLVLTWNERGGPRLEGEPEEEGFGSRLARAATAQFGVRMSQEWLPDGLTIRLSVPLARVSV